MTSKQSIGTGGPSFAARCVRGLEWIVAGELEARLHPVDVRIDHRTVLFRTPRTADARSLRLGAADDVFVVVGTVPGVEHTRAALQRIEGAVRRLDLTEAREVLAEVRGGPVGRRFTVGASFLGARRYNRYELEDAVAAGIAAGNGLSYTPTRSVDPADTELLTLRVHLAGERALVMLRLFDRPLHRRAYKESSVAGTLHPPVACAMAMLAGLDAGVRVVDPCCGGGTVLIEAGRVQPAARIQGFELDPARAVVARANAARAGMDLAVAVGDLARLPCGAGTVDRILSNLPWGVETELGGALRADGATRAFGELARVLRPGGRVVLLVGGTLNDPGALRRAGLSLLHSQRLSLFGQHPELWIAAPAGAGGDVLAPGAPFARELAAALPLAEPSGS